MDRPNRLSEITVGVNELIGIVVENRSKHIQDYNVAMDRFYVAANSALYDRLAQITREEIKDLRFDLPVPESHVDDYDRVVRMLEMTRDAGQETVVLNEGEQESYVMDNWGWKRTFIETSTFYAANG